MVESVHSLRMRLKKLQRPFPTQNLLRVYLYRLGSKDIFKKSKSVKALSLSTLAFFMASLSDNGCNRPSKRFGQRKTELEMSFVWVQRDLILWLGASLVIAHCYLHRCRDGLKNCCSSLRQPMARENVKTQARACDTSRVRVLWALTPGALGVVMLTKFRMCRVKKLSVETASKLYILHAWSKPDRFPKFYSYL